MELSISILNANNKHQMISILNSTDISYIHLDVMDGKFVSQKSLEIEEIIELSKISQKKLDIHLMVSNPIEYIENIKELKNIEYITIHLEINKDIKEILEKIKSYGYKAGISIKPNTNLNELIPYLEHLDMILLMTVEPGLGGQDFIESSVTRLAKLKEMIKDYNIKIEVDGGINNNTINKVKDADIAVIGTHITKSENPISTIKKLQV